MVDESPKNKAESKEEELVIPVVSNQTTSTASAQIEGLEEILGNAPNPTEPTKEDSQPPLQTTNPEKIRSRIESLPAAVRKVVDDKFHGEYFAIERIDQSKLI